MILVLSVLSIVTAIIFPIGDKWIRTTSEENALQAFIATIHSLQAYSMANMWLQDWISRIQERNMYIYLSSSREI